MAGIKDYSTTAANNNSTPPNGWPEQMKPSDVNDTARQNMADLRSWFEDSEWVNYGHTCTQASATTFTIAADVTTTYTADRRIQVVDSSTLYGFIVSSSFSSPNTTVTVELESGSLSASMNGQTVSLGAIKPTNDSLPKNYKYALHTYAADAEASDTDVITLAPTPVAYEIGMVTSDLANNDILANQIVSVVYDGTNFQMLSGGGIPNVEADTAPKAGGNFDVNGNEIISVGGTNIVIHSDNNVDVVLGDAAGADKVNVKDSGGTTVATIDSDGRVTGVVLESSSTDETTSIVVNSATSTGTMKFGGSSNRTWTLPNASGTFPTTSSSSTFTNKSISGSTNTLSNIAVSSLANGTDGEIITWSAAGVATTVGPGTSGQVLTSNGAGAAPSFQASGGGGGGFALIESKTASSSSNITFTDLTSSYIAYELVIVNLIPATDGTVLYFRTSTNNGSSYDSSAGNYHWRRRYNDNAASGFERSNSDTEIELLNGAGSSSNELINVTIRLFNPSAATYTMIKWEGTQTNSSGVLVDWTGSGSRTSAADVDAIEIQMSSGNISSGEFRLFGLAAS